MEYTFYPGKVVDGSEAYLIGIISSTDGVRSLLLFLPGVLQGNFMS